MDHENFTLMILEGLFCLLIGISSFILAKGTDGKYNFLFQLNLS